MITRETFEEAVLEKADQLNVVPKFLLIAIAGTADWDGKPDAKQFIEDLITKKYFRELLSDMQESARLQTRSKRASAREAGEAALQKFDIKDLPVYGLEPSELFKYADKLDKLTAAHVVAAKNVIKEVDKLKTKYNFEFIVDVVVALCSTELEKLKELSSFFEQDFLYN